ncbi:hypothetical protein NEICINOT_03089 [Neisseria cinerea ATCC 14685]|uniref:Uncharacterized protein n=1 Tax=Neisseria cinerea ATCC 14685 TaxID=546262 RepID=D0W0C3_NEICI|nr:hypothetical protein NEICINOT_03089 [Neisseria cinerea ATCC 14685]
MPSSVGRFDIVPYAACLWIKSLCPEVWRSGIKFVQRLKSVCVRE